MTELFDSLAYGPAPEAAKPANEWLESHDRSFGQFIGGQWIKPSASFEVFNPATSERIAKVGQAGKEDVDAAVAAARSALPGWKSSGCHARAKVLYAIARQLQKHSRLFAVLESIDNGKPIRETRDLDIPIATRHFYHHAGWAQLLDEEFPGFHEVGVCGQIIPWNFPLLMLAWKIAPALAAGNTVVLKPAEFTPLSALLFAEICERAGVPAGVVNILTGDGEAGRHIVEHPDVDKIAFTGSTEVGRIIRKATSGTSKKLSLELGGKSPFVVFDDADLDSAVEGCVDAIWFNQGQVCCAGSRLLVQESVAEKFFEKLKHRMSTLRVGDPLDKAVDIGAIVDQVQLERIDSLVRQGVSEGAHLFQPSCQLPASGWFFPPTLLTNVEPASTVAQVEIFGPVLVAMTFRTPAEAVSLSNNTVYGLAASVWTESLSLAHDIASKIKAGTVWVNCTNQFDGACGFGGYRESGYGREGGREGMYEYLVSDQPGRASSPAMEPDAGGLDRTHKHYIGGKQARPDGGLSFIHKGIEFARGNRKDVRNAVEAAASAQASWASTSAHLRAQILYYLGENLIDSALGKHPECQAAVETLFRYAAIADKHDGLVHSPPIRGFAYTLNEPIGVIGIVLGSGSGLVGLMECIASALAMGNTVVAIPPQDDPLPAVELYRVLEASDVPAGVVNLVTGVQSEIAPTLAEHLGVDAIWDFSESGSTSVAFSVGNLKQTWVRPTWGMTREFCRRATQVKNIWIPQGE